MQTHTPVKLIIDIYEDSYATVRTDRGDIRATHVVHATNAWLGRLLPELRPYVSPVRGNVVAYSPVKMTAEASKSALGLRSENCLWLRYGVKDYDYVIQREDGVVVAGRANKGSTVTGDDSATDFVPMSHLCGFAHEALAPPSPDASMHIVCAWAGIIGFTQDAVPFSGRLPFPGRRHQWVCGRYHATGMIKAFLAAQMVAGLILGETPSDECPRSIFTTPNRIRVLTKSLEEGRPVINKSKL